MKYILLFVSLQLLYACQTKNKNSTKSNDLSKDDKTTAVVNFNIDANPISFSANTTSNGSFNLNKYKNKYLVIFIYDKKQIIKNNDWPFDLIKDYNKTCETFKNNFSFIGIIDGFIEDQHQLDTILNNSSKPLFAQIDNTESYNKQKKINHNIYCTPATIIIAPTGKVIYNGCGSTTEILNFKLDSISKR